MSTNLQVTENADTLEEIPRQAKWVGDNGMLLANDTLNILDRVTDKRRADQKAVR